MVAPHGPVAHGPIPGKAFAQAPPDSITGVMGANSQPFPSEGWGVEWGVEGQGGRGSGLSLQHHSHIDLVKALPVAQGSNPEAKIGCKLA